MTPDAPHPRASAFLPRDRPRLAGGLAANGRRASGPAVQNATRQRSGPRRGPASPAEAARLAAQLPPALHLLGRQHLQDLLAALLQALLPALRRLGRPAPLRLERFFLDLADLLLLLGRQLEGRDDLRVA